MNLFIFWTENAFPRPQADNFIVVSIGNACKHANIILTFLVTVCGF